MSDRSNGAPFAHRDHEAEPGRLVCGGAARQDEPVLVRPQGPREAGRWLRLRAAAPPQPIERLVATPIAACISVALRL